MMKRFAILILSAFSIFSQANYLGLTGTAYNEKGDIAYIEKHKLYIEGDKILKLETTYFSKEGKDIGYLKSQKNKDFYVPSYQFFDRRSQRKVEVNVVEKVIETKIKRKEKEERNSLTLVENMVAGQGLYFYLFENLVRFKAEPNKTQEVNFFIPLNGTYYEFLISVKEKTKRTLTYNIRSNFWLVRLFAPEIEATYDLKSGHLIEYRGPSNLLDENQDTFNVLIKYE